ARVRRCITVLNEQRSTKNHQPVSRFLLVDNSNSFTKFALATRKKIGSRRKIATPFLTAKALHDLIGGWSFEVVVLSSVVPEKGRLLANVLDARVLRVSPKLDLGIGIDF